MANTAIQYLFAEESHREIVASRWRPFVADYLRFKDGFSILALDGQNPVGALAVYWQPLTPPLDYLTEGYIDIIEVHPDYRRQGIAKQMVNLAAQRAQEAHAYQLRAWSSDDKLEALPMWADLGFGLTPATVYPKGDAVHGYYVTWVVSPPGKAAANEA